MAYTTGTAANYQDLLAVMVTFAAAQGWAILEQSATRIYLKGPGLAGLDEIYVGVETYADSPNNRYNWNMVGSWGWVTGRTLGKHPRSSLGVTTTNQVVGYFWNSPMTYWMTANGRRIIVVAKVGATYQMIHLGLLTVPATDAQYPYPLYIGGSGNLLTQNYTAAIRVFWGSQTANARFVSPGGVWGTQATGTYLEYNPGILPITFNEVDRSIMLTGLDGSYLLEPIYLVSGTTLLTTYGFIEGLFRVTGYNNTAENIITVGGVNYMVFPDGAYSTFGDFCVMRLN